MPSRGQPPQLLDVKGIRLHPDIHSMSMTPNIGEQYEKCPRKKHQRQKTSKAPRFPQ